MCIGCVLLDSAKNKYFAEIGVVYTALLSSYSENVVWTGLHINKLMTGFRLEFECSLTDEQLVEINGRMQDIAKQNPDPIKINLMYVNSLLIIKFLK